MKKLVLDFPGMRDMLTKEQMKKIKGGYSSSSQGTCDVTVQCVANDRTKDIKCNGTGGQCFHSDPPEGWVQCNTDAKIKCA